MKAPFGLKTKGGNPGFQVNRSWSAQRYVIWINGFPKDLWDGGGLGEARKDYMTDVRRFIEEAITEKLQRTEGGEG